MLTISSSDRRAPSTRASTSAETMSSRGSARRSPINSRTYSWNSAAASFAERCRFVRNVELVHLHHAVRPVEQVAVTIERNAEHPADDGDRVRLRVVVEELHLTRLGERLEQLAGKLVGRLAQRLDAARREGRGDELAQAGVVGRLEPEETPALGIPERPASADRAAERRSPRVSERAGSCDRAACPGGSCGRPRAWSRTSAPASARRRRGVPRAAGSAPGRDPSRKPGSEGSNEIVCVTATGLTIRLHPAVLLP